MSENELKIVKTMQRAAGPLMLTKIAERARMAHQLVDYHLENLMGKGLVVRDSLEGKTYYMLQPPFYDPGWRDAFLKQVTPLAEAISTELILDLTEVPQERVVINILATQLKIFQEELSKLI